MGDVGSCFIGYVFGVLALIGAHDGSIPVTIWVILLAIFIVDSSLTLLRRMATAERWFNAHRSHAYQRLIQMGWSHQSLATLLVAYNVVILWPLAYGSFVWREWNLIFCLASILLTGGVWLYVNRRFNDFGMRGGSAL